VTLNGLSTVSNNTAVSGSLGPGEGGGIYSFCGMLPGAVAGGNVRHNAPDDIYVSTC
jgi:hypothetical protein